MIGSFSTQHWIEALLLHGLVGECVAQGTTLGYGQGQPVTQHRHVDCRAVRAEVSIRTL